MAASSGRSLEGLLFDFAKASAQERGLQVDETLWQPLAGEAPQP